MAMVNQIGQVDQAVPGIKQTGVSGGQAVTDDFSRLLKLVSVVEKAAKNEIFYPRENSFYCASCQYKNVCRECIVP